MSVLSTLAPALYHLAELLAARPDCSAEYVNASLPLMGIGNTRTRPMSTCVSIPPEPDPGTWGAPRFARPSHRVVGTGAQAFSSLGRKICGAPDRQL